MKLYRISSCRYITDLSGRGAAIYGGRWNSKEIAMLYTTRNPSSAMLDVLAQAGTMELPELCLLILEVPEESLEILDIQALPPNWKCCPPLRQTQDTGNAFVRSGKSLMMQVPSALIQEDANILINPGHPDAARIKIVEYRQLRITPRLLPK